MALQHSLSLPTGIDLIAAYTRISSIRHTHLETLVSVETWANQEARQNGLSLIRQQSYSIPWLDEVSLTSAYEALKTLEDFTGAVDV